MPANAPQQQVPSLLGRSSSHFTRLARIFAAELGVEYAYQPILDLLSLDVSTYGSNPALKLPILRTARGDWFGTLNICRELARLSSGERRIVWPENLDQPLLANAQELVLHAMATGVTLNMSKVGGESDGSRYTLKMRQSLANTLSWLDGNLSGVLRELPEERDLSFLEVALFCSFTHLKFRELLPTGEYRALAEFARQFSSRASAQQTPYYFDA